jgi:hypothetical protein
MDNSFLRSFLNMRAGLNRDEEPHRGPKHGTKAMPEPTGISIQTIIEEKPDKKEVLEYFRCRIAEFEDDD